MIALWKPSPNWNERPKGSGPDLVVIHGTAGTSVQTDLDWLRDPHSRVSYHYLIARDGAVYQLVKESARAWHAGKSLWGGRPNVNDFSIGVALSNDGSAPYPEAQIQSAARVTADILKRRGLRLDRVLGHADVSPGRKSDPWPHFPWRDFRVAVIQHLHPPPAPLKLNPKPEDEVRDIAA